MRSDKYDGPHAVLVCQLDLVGFWKVSAVAYEQDGVLDLYVVSLKLFKVTWSTVVCIIVSAFLRVVSCQTIGVIGEIMHIVIVKFVKSSGPRTISKAHVGLLGVMLRIVNGSLKFFKQNMAQAVAVHKRLNVAGQREITPGAGNVGH